MSNLLNWPILGWVYRSPKALTLLRIGVLILFLSGIAFGLMYPTTEQNPYTNALFWSLFWPFFIIVTMVSLGPAFCSICPHSFVGAWLSKLGAKQGKQKTLPKRWRNRWLGFGFLLLSYWLPLYAFPGLIKIPVVTAVYFLLITLVAWAVFYRYRNMDYCRYLCPIGPVIKNLGKVDFVQLQTHQDDCKTCRSFDCVKSCDWKLKPYLFEEKNNMQDCTLCMDCAQACDSVQWNVTSFAKQAVHPIKGFERMTVWVFLWLLAVITFAMRFHHGLGHSPLKPELPWVQLGGWLNTVMPAIPMIDWVGAVALIMAILTAFSLVFAGFWMVAKLNRIAFWQVFDRAGMALGVLMLVGALSHIGSSLFTHYVSDWVNAYYWLIGSTQQMTPLASHRDGWVHLFGWFNYAAVIASAWILWKNLQTLPLKAGRKWLSFASAGLVIWAYLAIVLMTAWAQTLPRH